MTNIIRSGCLFSTVVLLSLGCVSCRNRDRNAVPTQPVVRDLDRILEDDTLRVITRNHPLTYYLYRGSRRGFDYELIKKFAEEQGLVLEIVIPPRWVDMIPDLNAGKGDVIAALMTVTPEREEEIAFTRPYLEVWQVTVGTESVPPPKTLEELNGRKVLVRRGSSYEERLKELQLQGIKVEIELLDDSLEVREPVEIVAQGRAELTVVDNTIARLEEQFYPGLIEGVKISQAQSIAWGVRSNAPQLQAALNEFLTRYYRSAYFNILKNRYFENTGHFLRHRSAQLALARDGRISRFDDAFRNAAEKTGFDWRLIAAQAYHESNFYPDKTSWAGAVGLMQLMPNTANSLGVKNLYDPKENVLGGARYLRQLYDRYSDVPEKDRLSFALAAYNVGPGHVYDAREIVRHNDGDPNNWNSVAAALISLEKPEVYRKAVYGFCKGTSVVDYVADVLERYEIFKHLVDRSPEPRNPA